jgi:hypothetical protein
MTPSRAAVPFSRVYQTAWQACREFWPVFIAQFLYIIFNYGAFFFCLMITFWPLLEKIFQAVQGGAVLSQADYQGWISDFFLKAQDFNWLFMVIGIFLLYLTWWSILSAWFNGGLYGRFWAWMEGEKKFSWMDFLKDGFYHLIPMVLVQSYVVIFFMLVFMVLFLTILFFGVVLSLLHTPLALEILLAIPLPFLFLGLMVFFGVYFFTAQGCVTRDRGPWTAFKEGAQSCWADGGRIFRGMGLILVVYLVTAILLQLILKVFSYLPFLGFLFTLADFGVGILFTIWSGIYFPALAVVFLSEREAKG